SAGLNPAFVSPNVDEANGIAHGVTPEALDRAIRSHTQPVTAVYLVTPSYFGAVADVAALAEVAHAAGAALIVDAAWGAHFGFHPDLPASPVTQGADIVIMSTHKLAGSLTQSAVLHLGDTELADRLEPALAQAFMMTASTSENAHLLASIDLARRALMTSGEAITQSLENIRYVRAQLEATERYHLLSGEFLGYADVVDIDPFRLPIDITATGLDGHTVRKRLAEEFDIFPEMSTATTLVALIGIGKSPEIDRLIDALEALRLDTAAQTEAAEAASPLPPLPAPGRLVLTPRAADLAVSELVPATQAPGRVSVGSLGAYPPGIPCVLRGGEIAAETIDFLRAVAASPSGHVRGAADAELQHFRVTKF